MLADRSRERIASSVPSWFQVSKRSQDGRPGAELRGQIAPGGAGPEDPEDAVEDLTAISPGTARASGRGKEVSDELPLLIRESVPHNLEAASLTCVPVHTILGGRSIVTRR